MKPKRKELPKIINHYKKIMYAMYVFVFCILGLVIMYDYQGFMANEKLSDFHLVNNKKNDLDSTIVLTTNYIERLKAFSEDFFQNHRELTDNQRAEYIDKISMSPAHYKLKGVRETPEDSIGLYITSSVRPDEDSLISLKMSYPILERLRISKNIVKQLSWTYFVSAEGIVLLYPYIKVEEIYKGTGTDNIDDAVDTAVYKKEHWHLALLKNNPDKKSFWTDVYFDDAGTGLMVSHGAPIYIKDKFIGMIATDVNLSYLDTVIDKTENGHSDIFLISDKNQIMSHSKINIAKFTDVPNLKEVYDGNVEKMISNMGIEKKELIENGYYIFKERLENAPWSVVYLAKKSTYIKIFLNSRYYYFLVILILGILMASTQYVVKKRVTEPVSSIVSYLYNEAEGIKTDVPELTSEWDMWIKLIKSYPSLWNVALNLPGIVFRIKNIDGKYMIECSGDKVREIFDKKNGDELYFEEIFDSMSDTSRKGLLLALDKSFSEFINLEFEGRFYGKEKNMWLAFSGSPLKLVDETYVDGVILDVTERHEAVEKLSALNRELELRVDEESKKRMLQEKALLQKSKYESMGEMLTNISHQWRQPLGHIAGIMINLSFLIAGQPENDRAKQLVREAEKSLKYMSNTIDSFRDFISPNKEKEAFYIKDAVKMAMAIVEPSLNHCNIKINENYECEKTVFGVRNELSHVIMNILNNSKDALVQSKLLNPEIFLNSSNDGNYVYLKIYDNAGGIPEEFLEKVFEPFHTTKITGQGIGLSMAKEIVEKSFNGEILLSNNDIGAEFIIKIPINLL